MHRSRPGQMRSPFKQANTSSSSLEGMERPVRSFKSFIKAVPPNPNSSPIDNKPLPPTPTPPKKSPSPASIESSEPPTTPRRTASVASWKAPADWFNGTSEGRVSNQNSAIPSSRVYSPLLPDPSPDVEKYMDFRTALEQTFPPQSRLMPIYEKTNPDLGPPRSPPRSPLPRLPASKAREGSPDMPMYHLPTGRPGHAVTSSTSPSRVPRTTSPAGSGSSERSQHALKEKAFASMGLDSPTKQAQLLQSERSPPDSLENRDRSDQQYVVGRIYRAINHGSPTGEESWEDPDLDEKSRQLSFSQDYHDMLADQYQEMSLRPRVQEVQEPARRSGEDMQHTTTTSTPAHAPHNRHLVPRPLTWRKSSSNSSPRSASPDRIEEAPTTPERTEETPTPETASLTKKEARSKKIRSWVPHRLSVAPKRTPSQQSVKKKEKRQKDESETAFKLKTQPKKSSTDELRFSRFFPPSDRLRIGRKTPKKGKLVTEKEPVRAQTPNQIMRLPGGLAVVRSPPRSGSTSTAATSQRGSREKGRRRSGQEHDAESQANHMSGQSQGSTSTVPPRPFAHLSTSTATSQQSESQPHTRTPPPVTKSTASKLSWRRPRSESPINADADSHANSNSNPETNKNSGFIAKARDARRKRDQENRQARLKKSIRVLGPTDPDVVASYVRSREGEGETGEAGRDGLMGVGSGRLPGYLVEGTG